MTARRYRNPAVEFVDWAWWCLASAVVWLGRRLVQTWGDVTAALHDPADHSARWLTGGLLLALLAWVLTVVVGW